MGTTGERSRKVADRYVLRLGLGRGGSGVVWLADDEVLQRQVAIKEVALPQTLDEGERAALRARVMREARAAARLNHPNVTTVFDVLQEDGHAWIVMEYVDAPTLADLVERYGTMRPSDAAALGLEVLRALEVAHENGIVHRDVKPRNVMVPKQGAIKLTDFGIAALKDDPKITQTGLIIGSPSFMAPEQATHGSSGPASDLWGLGATLYYAVEGVPPFDRGEALPTVTAVVHDEPRALRKAGVLAPVITRLLAKDPQARPTAPELRSLLTDVAMHEPSVPVLDDDEAPWPHAPGAVVDDRREARPWALLFGVAALVALATVLLLRSGGTSPQPEPVAQDTDAARPPEIVESPSETQAEGEGSASPPPTANAVPSPAVATPEIRSQPAVPAPAPAPQGGDSTPASAGEGREQSGADEAQTGRSPSLPVGWTRYAIGETGATVGRPPGWRERRLDESRVDLVDPGGGRYLRIDWTGTPPADPVADWRRQSQAFGARKDNYREIRIEPVDFRGRDAAMWEYTYTERGSDLHAYNLGINAGEYGFALNFQTREALWSESQELFEQFVGTFRLPPAG